MSRDQRPRREVMVDAPSETRAAIAGDAAGSGNGGKTAPQSPANPRLKLASLLFLLGCAGGGILIALFVPGFTA